MQVIGLCRFSYPAEGGFQVEHDGLQERQDYLYSPARIEERFRQFETICLPGLKAQTDPDFVFVVLVGDSLPRPYAERLARLLEGFPQARIVARPPGPHRKVCQDVINRARDLGQPCLQFRHDDDDAVAVTYIERLRDAAQSCKGLLDKNGLVAIDFNRGYIARPDAHGLLAEPNLTPFYGVALAVAAQPGVRQTIMNYGHNRLNSFMPTISQTDSPMYVRGHNDHNDSRQKKHVKPIELPRLNSAGEAKFRQIFAIDADHIRQVYSNT